MSGHVVGAVFGSENNVGTLPENLFFRPAENGFRAAVPSRDVALWVQGKNGVFARVFHHHPQALLALAQGCARRRALGDVERHADDKAATVAQSSGRGSAEGPVALFPGAGLDFDLEFDLAQLAVEKFAHMIPHNVGTRTVCVIQPGLESRDFLT